MKKYLDIPLIAFVLPMLAAASITSHGTYIFYSYFLPNELAIAATVVLTLGIPLLEFAAVMDTVNWLRYILGMVWLLFMEAAAQYWQGQAIFASKVHEQFPNPAGIDLATWANDPTGRILPIVYLASLSGLVVYFGYAASVRVKQLRGISTATEPVSEDDTEQVPVSVSAGKLTGKDVLGAYHRNQNNKSKTAQELGVTPRSIAQWLVRNGVEA